MFFVGLSSIGGKTIMYFRFFISFSFSCIVSFPIPIMFQNNKIENYLKEQIENKKLVLDSIYKQDTNKNFEILLKKEKVRNDGLEAYSNEGLTGKGENYVIKREKYMKDSLDWYNEKLKVDSLQGVINAKYEERLNYIKNIKSADYFTKLEAMFAMAFGGNILMIFMIIITFVPLVLIDLIPIVFKLGLKKAVAEYNHYRDIKIEQLKSNNEILLTKKNEIYLNKKQVELEIEQTKLDIATAEEKNRIKFEEVEIQLKFDLKKQKLEDELKINFPKSAKKISEILNSNISNENIVNEKIFKLTKSMQSAIERIRKNSNEDNFIYNLYLWILDNIKYDENHSTEFYRSARQVYNEKRAVCGEFVILQMAFLKYINIESHFVEVAMDNDGKEVVHACLGVKRGKGIQLIDIAYRSFDIFHKKYRVIDENELDMKFNNWNK